MSIVQCSLNQIPLGKRCKVTQLNSTGSIRTRLQDIGLVQGTELIPLVKKLRRRSGRLSDPRHSHCHSRQRFPFHPCRA